MKVKDMRSKGIIGTAARAKPGNGGENMATSSREDSSTTVRKAPTTAEKKTTAPAESHKTETKPAQNRAKEEKRAADKEGEENGGRETTAPSTQRLGGAWGNRATKTA
jgi:hypothetical protein